MKNFCRYVYSFWQNVWTWLTHRQTDGQTHTAWRHRPRLYIASRGKVIQFWWNLVHKCRFRTRWQSRDQISKFLKFETANDSHFKNSFFGHNSAANCSISVKFCTGKQNSMAIEVTWHKLSISKIQDGRQSRDHIWFFFKFKTVDGRRIKNRFWP